MPLDPTFDLKGYVTPVITETLFETVDIVKERITAALTKILPRNEFLVGIVQDPNTHVCNGTIYAKYNDDKFKALEFTVQPVNADFTDTLS